MTSVLFFIPRFPPYAGGSSIYSSTIVDSLSDEINFKIITRYHDEKAVIDYENEAMIIRAIPDTSGLPFILRGMVESVISLVFTAFILITEDIDFAHIHPGSFAAPGVVTMSVLFRLPIAYDCRDEMFPVWLTKIGRAIKWFSCSENVDERLERAGISSNDIIRIPVVSPPYIDEFKKLSMTSKFQNRKFRFVFIGRIIEEKGIDILIDAFRRFDSEYDGAELILIGDDPSGIVGKSIGPSVSWMGEVSHKEAMRELAKSDVLILPSKSEGMPRAIVEAFELGVPVIATPTGGVPNLINGQESGLLTDPNPTSLYKSMVKLYTDTELRERIKRHELEKAEKWDWKTVQARLFRAYRSMSK